MARIAGVNIPDNKHAVISQTYIFGVGRTTAKELCAATGVAESAKIGELSEEQIQRIAGTYRSFIGEKGYPKYENIPGYCQVSKIEDIAKNNYVLTPGRYVGAEEIEDDGEPFEDKMKRLTQEYARLTDESAKLDKEIRKNLKEIGFEI